MIRTRLGTLAALGALLLTLPACDSGGGADDGPFGEAEANPGTWSYVAVDGAMCRNGSPTGFGVRVQEGATNTAIYFEGGGACFNAETCAANPAAFNESSFTSFANNRGDAGIFSPSAPNPVAGWNMVYVPYCTGDVHGGSAPNATVEGVEGTQQFVGHQNLELYLDLLAPYFADAGQVLVTGASAGGFGALLNFATVADAFPNAQMTLLDDSGPVFFADNVFSPQLAAAFSSLFNFPDAFPADATPLFAADGLEDVYGYYASRYPTANLGLSSYLQDNTIRFFFGFGQADGSISGAEYAAGLRDLDDQAPDALKTYFVEGTDHTIITQAPRFGGSSAGVAFTDWFAQLLAGTAPDVDPAPVSTRVGL